MSSTLFTGHSAGRPLAAGVLLVACLAAPGNGVAQVAPSRGHVLVRVVVDSSGGDVPGAVVTLACEAAEHVVFDRVSRAAPVEVRFPTAS